MDKTSPAATWSVDAPFEASLPGPKRRRAASVLTAVALPATTAAYASAAVKLPPFSTD